MLYFLVFVMLSCLFIAALERADLMALVVIFNCFVTFPCGILGQMWYLIVLIPDLCHLSYSEYICCRHKKQTSFSIQKCAGKTKIKLLPRTLFLRAPVTRAACINFYDDFSASCFF